jgi:hypothetical protein
MLSVPTGHKLRAFLAFLSVKRKENRFNSKTPLLTSNLISREMSISELQN